MKMSIILILSSIITIGLSQEASSPATPLIDGLLVSGGTGLRTLSANWILLVALDAPIPPSGLADQIQVVRSSISTVTKEYGITDAVQETWMDRLARMDPTTTGHTHHRYRRGLFDMGGMIIHKIFGLATDDQIKKYQKILNSLRLNMNDVIHVVPELITAVNQSRQYIRENRAKLQQIETHQEEITKYIEQLRVQGISYRTRITSLEIRQEMDRIMQALELVSDVYQQERAAYHVQRAALEVGHLTEDLLPPRTLEDILNQAISQGYHIVTQLEWYYQHLEVKPIFSESDNLLYQVIIPLIDNEQYLQYKIQTFPVPYINSELSAKLEVPEHLGFNTETGELFLPQFCQGENPSVCRSGPVYQSNRLQCPRGVLTGVKALNKYCTVEVVKGTNTTQITEIDINTYVMTTWGEIIIERCAGVNEKSYMLSANTYILKVCSTCSISGHNWAIHGIEEENINKHIRQEIITLPSKLNITKSLNKADLPQLFLHADKNVEMSAIQNVPIHLRSDLFRKGQLKQNKGHLTWIHLGVTMLIVLLSLTVVGYLAFKHVYCNLKMLKQKYYIPTPAPVPKVPEEVELTQIDVTN